MNTPFNGGSAADGNVNGTWHPLQRIATPTGTTHVRSDVQYRADGYAQVAHSSSAQWTGPGPWQLSHATLGHRSTPSKAFQQPSPSQALQASSGPEPSTILIALAETYFESAHANGYRIVLGQNEEVEGYCQVVSTGLACLESALQYRLQPRTEAIVRLRYASILFNETENLDGAEDALNKGILLAGRNNITDIKYKMQHLLARIMFNTSPKAALKLLSTYITESETLDIPLWTYSYRFLRFHLLMEQSSVRDEQAAVLGLQKIGSLAKARRDFVVAALVCLMEAMISLSNGVDGVEVSQRALARVYALHNGGMVLPPQLQVLLRIVDISCSVMTGRTQECDNKVRDLHIMLDDKERWTSWRETGDFEIPLNPSQPGRSPEYLRLRWLTKDDIFTVGYFLSGVCKFQRNVEENGKAERFLCEGLRAADRMVEAAKKLPSSLENARDKLLWKTRMKCYMQLYYCFLLCIRTDWDGAIKNFQSLEHIAQPLNLQDTGLGNLITYLQAVILHGTNDLYRALHMYCSVFNALPPESELSIICKLNAVLILRTQDNSQEEALLASVERIASTHKNENIKAAHATVVATQRAELVKTKNNLSKALRHATLATNQQLTFIVLSFMCHRFFSGVVSEQAEKSAKAAMQNAKKGRDSLWTYMGGQMYADCLSLKGNEFEASRQRQLNEETRAIVCKNLARNSPPAGEQYLQSKLAPG